RGQQGAAAGRALLAPRRVLVAGIEQHHPGGGDAVVQRDRGAGVAQPREGQRDPVVLAEHQALRRLVRAQLAPGLELGRRDVHEERDRRIDGNGWRHACVGSGTSTGRAAIPATGILRPLPGIPGMQRRLLFIPVSGGNGGGELQRALIIARTLRGQAGDAVAIRFLVHERAPFPRDEFEAVPLPGSPTRSEGEVAAAIAGFAPHLCLFDSSLRMGALHAARAAGSRTVYLSARPNSRWRGLDPRKRRLLDAHWLLAPERLGARPPWPERLGQLLLRDTRFRYFDAVFEPPDQAGATQLLTTHGLEAGGYDLVCPGGPGYVVDGMAPMALMAAAGGRSRDLPVLAVDPREH